MDFFHDYEIDKGKQQKAKQNFPKPVLAMKQGCQLSPGQYNDHNNKHRNHNLRFLSVFKWGK